jgi:hypothetical protein
MKTSLRKWKWLKNPKVKIISLVSALVLWFLVSLGGQYEHAVNVRLQLINKPTDWIYKEPVPERVRVLFRGTGFDLILFNLSQRTITINIGDQGTDFAIKLTTEHVLDGLTSRLPSLEPLEVLEPETLKVQLDRFVERFVPVESHLNLLPLDGFVLVGPVKLEPDSIRISGPQVLVNAIDTVYTENITVNNLMKAYDGKAELEPPEWETVTYSVKDIQYQVDVQGLGERLMTEIPVNVVNVPEGYKVTVIPSTLSLKLRGGVRLLAELDREDFEVTIDYGSRYRYENRRFPANIDYPAGVSFSDPNPSHFEVVVER